MLVSFSWLHPEFEKLWHCTFGVNSLWSSWENRPNQVGLKSLKSHPLSVPHCESSLLIIVSALAGTFHFHFFVYLLPWDLHSKQGLLFNGTIIKCAVSKHWCCALSLFTHPYASNPHSPTSPLPHSAAFLEVNTSKSLAAKHRAKCS